MLSITNLNIKNKLIAIIMIASSIAVFLAGSILIAYSAYSSRINLARELSSLAAVIGNNCKVILSFNVPEDAKIVLSTLEAKKSIVYACIYDLNNEIFSAYRPQSAGKIIPPSDVRENTYMFENGFLHVFHPVFVDQMIVGVIYFQDDMRYFYHGIRNYIIALFITVLSALSVAYIISSRLQKMISKPVLSLAAIAKMVSQKKDYAIRAEKESDDEVGILIDSFNSMLGNIQRRDIAIRESEEKYRTLIENIPQKIFYKDKKSVYVTCNGNYARDLNITPEEIVGKTDYDFFSEELAEKYVADDSRILHSGQSETLEERYILEGKEYTVQTIKTPIKDENNNLIGLLGIFWDITDRIKAEEQIKASLREKEVLLKEIHHRVKNNMQVIISLLKLQSQNIPDNQYLEMFKESQNRIRSMALVHEKLYQTRDLADVDFKGYVKSLLTSLLRSYGSNTDKVTMDVDVKDLSLGLESAIPCGLIINELVSNALKYAFPGNRNGVIRVSLNLVDDEHVELGVSDNGVGIPERIDINNTDSMGLHLVMILSEDQLMGDVGLNRENGTAFRIRFRKHSYKARI